MEVRAEWYGGSASYTGFTVHYQRKFDVNKLDFRTPQLPKRQHGKHETADPEVVPVPVPGWSAWEALQ